MTARLLITSLALGLLAACNQQPSPAPAETAPSSPQGEAPAADTAANPTVRQNPVAARVSQAGADAIDSQPGPDGSTWDLTKAKVTGNLLTVQFTVRPKLNDDISYYGEVADISVVDDATSQRYGIVKDEAGQPLVSDRSGDRLHLDTGRDETGIVWAKFPAPPPTSNTISINFPEVGTFDGVPVTR